MLLGGKTTFKSYQGVGGGREVQEGGDIYLWMIHVDVWRKPTQYCKAIILQLKINKLKKIIRGILWWFSGGEDSKLSLQGAGSSIPGWGTRILQATRHSQKKKKLSVA